MNTQEIIEALIDENSTQRQFRNRAYHDDPDFECYRARRKLAVELMIHELEFTPAQDGPLSKEGENVEFRSGLSSTFKIDDIIVNITRLMDDEVQYTFIILKKPSQCSYSWREVLKLWQLEPLFSSS